MSTDTATARDAAIDWAHEHADDAEHALFDLLRIESISTQPDHASDCVAAAEFLAADLRTSGLEHAQVMETGGHPVVYADWLHAGDSAPTVIVYGHYDVQPPDPLEEWNTPPFEPTVRDGNVHARGAADDKGQLAVHIRSVQACLATSGALPVNVKFLLEGEEESGSEHLDAFIEREKDLLAADVCLISDSHMLSATQPSLISSLRGMAYMEIEVIGPAHDLHSGTYGGGVRNPAEALASILAQLKDHATGRILVPGFYDNVVELSATDRSELARVPFNDDAFRDESGVTQLWGEKGFTTYERVGARPTLEINGLVSGYGGEGAKTVLPSRALAKVSMRLVANQRWTTIAERFTVHVMSLAPSGVRVEVRSLHGGDPSLVDTSSPAMAAASAALEQVFGMAPVFTREGGSIPVVTSFERLLGITTVLMGFGLPDDRLHSPNEKFSLAQFHKGIESSIRFWYELAEVSRTSS